MPMPQICKRAPPVGLGVLAWRLARRDPPQLLLAVAVVVPVVRHAQVAPARPSPVAEQHRQRAVAGAERDRRVVPSPAAAGRTSRLSSQPSSSGVQVVAERQRRQRVRALPRRAERDGPVVAAVDAERLVGVLEPAVAEAAQDDVAAAAQDDEVDVAVAVDVERVRTGDRGQVGDRRRQPVEAERTAHRALVAVERGRLGAAGEVQVGAPVVVAVEGGDAAADEELERRRRTVVDARAGSCRRRTAARPGGGADDDLPPRQATSAPHRRHDHDGDDRRRRRASPPPCVRRWCSSAEVSVATSSAMGSVQRGQHPTRSDGQDAGPFAHRNLGNGPCDERTARMPALSLIATPGMCR